MASNTIVENNEDTRLSLHTYQNPKSLYVQSEFNRNNRRLNVDMSPRTTYTPSNKDTESTTVHYGRRQLLINEIEFLTLCMNSLKNEMGPEWTQREIIVFYGGSAPGSHLLILANFFPFVKFILIDPKPFHLKYGNKDLRKNFEFHQKIFDQSLAESFYKIYNDNAKYVRLFVSDIRGTKTNEDIIRYEHDLQADLHRILKAYKSHLKFRLPYVSTNSKLQRTYLDGDIYFLIWGRSHTSEVIVYEHQLYIHSLLACDNNF